MQVDYIIVGQGLCGTLLSRQLVAAGKLLEIEVLDHLVIGERRFVSLREKRLGFG